MNDLISRKALLNEFPLPEDITDPVKVLKHITGVRAFIACAPAVDAVEVVHGRWVLKPHDGAFGVFHMWHCSVCDTIRARQDPYCGECGAKMDGGADNG